MSLLTDALAIHEERTERVITDRFREECELAVNYFNGTVFCGQVAKVLGYAKTAQVGSWASSMVMKGVRAGIIKLSIASGVE